MNRYYENDVFLSYATEDLPEVQKVFEALREVGIKAYIAEQDRGAQGNDKWKPRLLGIAEKSRYFCLFCTEKAADSDWVKLESETFFENVYQIDRERKMFCLLSEEMTEKDTPSIFKEFLSIRSVKNCLQTITSHLIDALRSERESMRSRLGAVEAKVREAYDHYGQKRFWQSFADNRNLHIFTCGREVETTPGDGRSGRGGRTNIDKWDYQTVLEITHYFAEHYPATRVTIEEPVPKLRSSSLSGAHGSYQVATLMRRLEGKDCVIVGSPDVSDFGEIVLAKIHGIQAFHKKRLKRAGFAIVKDGMKAPSSTYWLLRQEEREGVAWIEQEKVFETTEEDGAGKTYGILVVCDNPFSKPGKRNKIIILAGCTGVATHGIAKLLTSEACLDEFYKVDQQCGKLDFNFEALVGVPYSYDPDALDRDSRRIDVARPIEILEIERV